MILIKIIKFYTWQYILLRSPSFLLRNIKDFNFELQDKLIIREVCHNQIAAINWESKTFSTIINTSSSHSNLLLNDKSQSYAISINNPINLLEKAVKQKDLTLEIWNQCMHDFSLNLIYSGYASVYDNSEFVNFLNFSNFKDNLTTQFENLKYENQLNKRDVYIFNEKSN